MEQQNFREKYKRWMTNLPERLTQIPISCLAIPGSHDSASWKLYKSLGVGCHLPWIVRAAGSWCGCLETVIYNWSVTQHLTIPQQLNAGIRYLDLRIAFRSTSNEIRFIHGLYGELVIPTLKEIRTFLEENPDEILILDLQHFYSMHSNAHSRLLGAIHDIFKDVLIPFSEKDSGICMKDLTLANLWTTSFRVIVIYQDPHALSYKDLWPSGSIESPWADTSNADELLNFLEEIYADKRRPANYNLFGWQGVMTADLCTISLHLCNTLENYCAKKATEVIVPWLKQHSPGIQGLNICLADFVETSNFIPTVVELNDKIAQVDSCSSRGTVVRGKHEWDSCSKTVSKSM